MSYPEQSPHVAVRTLSSEPSVARRLLPKLVLSLLLGALFAWLVARGGVPLVPPASAFRAVVWWSVPAYAATLLVTHVLRASRWRFLISPVKKLPLKEVILLNWIGFFAIFAFPLRLGEFARPALTKARHGIPVSVGIGTVAVERVLDGLMTSACVAWALFALPRGATSDPLARSLPLYGYLSLSVFTSAFLGLGLFLWKRDFAIRLIERTFGLVSPRLGSFVADKVGGVAEGIRSLGHARLLLGFGLESLGYWLCNAFGMWLLARGCGLPLGFGHAVAVMGILAIGILLPTGPGLFGNFQLAVSAALKLYFAAELVSQAGAVYIFLLYAVQASLILVTGLVPLYAMRIRFGDLLRVSGASEVPPPP